MKNSITNKVNVKKITTVAMLTAIAAVLQFIEMSVPVVPFFIKLDFSDLPEIIGAFVCGPAAGVIIASIKNIIHLPFGSSLGIGELSNFILGASFAFSAGMIYKKLPNIKGVILAGICGSVIMGIVSLPVNYFIIYPLYFKFMMPLDSILSEYQKILPAVNSLAGALTVFNVPFTIVKGLICTALSSVIYKPLHTVLSKIK